jgi:CubicO group peptidase (beta-lactamase class C family)
MLAVVPWLAPGQEPRAKKLADIDETITAAIARGELPGAVIVIVHRGKVIYRKAFGDRAKQPSATAMTLDTVFDLASLSKPIVTALLALLLEHDGKLKVTDRVSEHLPAFRRKETDDVTIEHLLLHTSGLPAGNPLADYNDGPASAWNKLHAINPTSKPGDKFVYSDINYLLLGKLVETVGGNPLDKLAAQRIFTPAGMNTTRYNPDAKLRQRAAPTEKRDGTWLQGVVHDPRASKLGGVAGHAGLFSTADDLVIYTQMLLGQGKVGDQQVIPQAVVKTLSTPRKVPGGLRTYGWDMQTAYSSNRGDVFPAGVSYGHTGFTGTSLWLDPQSQTAVIFLSNRVHPDGKGNVTKLRGHVATLAAQALP